MDTKKLKNYIEIIEKAAATAYEAAAKANKAVTAAIEEYEAAE